MSRRNDRLSCAPSPPQLRAASTSSPLGPTAARSQQREREGEKKEIWGMFNPLLTSGCDVLHGGRQGLCSPLDGAG